MWQYLSDKAVNLGWNPGCVFFPFFTTLIDVLLSSPPTRPPFPPLSPRKTFTRIALTLRRFYTRQAALHQAIDPQTNLELPVFTAQEVVILSYSPDCKSLPDLPRATDKSSRYSSECRLAAERIYHDKEFWGTSSPLTSLSITHQIILAIDIECSCRSGPCDLVCYVNMVAKVVTCRDVFKTAWSRLHDSLQKRL
mgnify:FL=1